MLPAPSTRVCARLISAFFFFLFFFFFLCFFLFFLFVFVFSFLSELNNRTRGRSRGVGLSRNLLQLSFSWAPTETVRFMLDLLPMQTRQEVKQVKAYCSAVENPHNPFHEAVTDTKECRWMQMDALRLGRGKSWMGQAEDSILQLCQLTEVKQTKEWEKYPNRFRRLYETLLSENLGKHCRNN